MQPGPDSRWLMPALESLTADRDPNHGELVAILERAHERASSGAAFDHADTLTLLGVVARRLRAPSGRLGDFERSLTEVACACLNVMPRLTDGSDRAAARSELEPLTRMAGEIGTLGALLGLAAGVLEPTRRPFVGAHAASLGTAWARAGVDVAWVVQNTQGVDNPHTRARALAALAHDPTAIALLRERLLLDDDMKVRCGAIHALATDPSSRHRICELINDDDLVAADAVDAVADQAEMRPVLESLAWDAGGRSSARFRRIAAIRAIGLYPDLTPRLRALLRDGDRTIRLTAIRALAGDEESRPAILTSTADTDKYVRWTAECVTTTKQALRERLSEWLRELDPTQRAAAIPLIEELALVRPLLRDHDAFVRLVAVERLSSDPESIGALRQRIHDPHWRVRLAALTALRHDAETKEFVTRLPRPEPPDRIASLSQAAARVFHQGYGDPPFLPAMLSDGEFEVRMNAVLELGKCPDAPVDPPPPGYHDQRRGGRDPWDERLLAARALVAHPDLFDLLRRLVVPDDEAVRDAAFAALAESTGARAALVELLRNADETSVRSSAFIALARHAASRPLLRRILDEEIGLVEETIWRQRVEANPDRGLLLDDPIRQTKILECLLTDPETRPTLRRILGPTRTAEERAHARAALDAHVDLAPHERAHAEHVLYSACPEAIRRFAVRALADDVEARPRLMDILGDRFEPPTLRATVALALVDTPDVRDLAHAVLRGWRAWGLPDLEIYAALVAKYGMPSDARPTRPHPVAEVMNEIAAAEDPLPLISRRMFLVGADEAMDEIVALGERKNAPWLRPLVEKTALSDVSPVRRETACKVLRRWTAPRPASALRSSALVASALRVAGGTPTAGASRGEAADDQLARYLERPHPVAADTALGVAALGWVLLRLAWASVSGAMNEGEPLGELVELVEPVRRLMVHVRMDPMRLPRERSLHPIHNVVEALRVARLLVTSAPLETWLVCADVDAADLRFPTLEPGSANYGPVCFGLRLPQPC